MQFGNKKIKDVRFGSKSVVKAYYGLKLVWKKEKESLYDNYLTIEALRDGLTASLSTNVCQYSTDGVTWTSLAAGTATPAINTGEKLYFKATGLTPTSSAGIGTFTINRQFNLSGNCMSMLFGDEAKSNLDLTGKSYAFFRLFYNCKTLKSVSSGFLPATTLANYCYHQMFYDCTGLTTAPELPATTLVNYCYSQMFYACTGLTTAPDLPAMTLANNCYNQMFRDCTGLTSAPELPATTLAQYCYDSMFYGTNVLPDCTNIDFSSLTVLQSRGLNGLFAGTKVTDSDLRNILPINPETGNYWLPATTLANNCYSQMFYACTGLTTAPELPATTLANSCYADMFQGCTGLTTAPDLPATTLSTACYQQMFSGCTGLTTAPELPATTLSTACYQQMFSGCSNLNYIKAMFTTTPSTSYTGNWVSRVASTGTFVKNPDATWNVTGVNGVPIGWTIETLEDYYLTIEALEDGLTAKLSTNACQYSTDGVTWSTLAAGTTTPTINTGEKLYFKATGLTPTSSAGIGTFTVNKQFNLSGNCMSILFGDNGKDNYDLTGYNYAFYKLFYSCTTLKSVSSKFLPATTLTPYCYRDMFYGCSNLTTAPELPAMTLADNCYVEMFFGCTSLTTAPELPATTLTDNCYRAMFQHCSSLTTAPELPSTTLADSCYHYMFYGCSNLTTTPELPAMTLATNCYYYMFYGCTSLTTAPELPATTLTSSCYSGMFYKCTGLTSAPELPAITLATQCYNFMFSECSNLNYIKALFTTTPGTSYTSNWVYNVAPTGTFVKNADATWDVIGVNGVPKGWTVITDATYDNYLTIEALEDGLSASLSTNACQYSTDNCQTWNTLAAGTDTPTINTGEKISFKATGLTPTSSTGIGTFTVNKNFNLKGNVMSMLFGDNGKESYDLTGYDYAFSRLFRNCTTLKSVSSGFLPATTLASRCYDSMFYDCSNLTTAPELPATTVVSSCYDCMFYGCTGLTAAPELPAMTLATNCYQNMFRGCTSLTTAPVLPAMTLADYCYTDMFLGCTGLTTAPELPATTLEIHCYDQMFSGCTGLTTASELPATTLANYCYSQMFLGCTGLTTAPELPATTLEIHCYDSMFYGCTGLTTAPDLPATTLSTACYQQMFSGCTGLTTAPELPATTLSTACYQQMFSGCSNLNYIKAMFTTTPGTSYTNNWVSGVASTGTFVKNPAATWNVTGNNGVPSGWTVTTETQSPTLISFTINNTSYQAEEPMPWGMWVESQYNTNGYQIIGDYIYTETGSSKVSRNASVPVTVNEYIESGYNYIQVHSGGSDD